MRKETPWTPGPWRVDPAFPLDIQTVDGMDIGSAIPYIESGEKWLIAGVPRPSIEESKVNARLIAAAPEMAKELRCLVDWLTDNQQTIDGEFSMDALLADARALLAKINGDNT